MGKGDKRSRRGKITIKSYGKSRPRRKQNAKQDVKKEDKEK